jgi:hypothetical protein
VTRGFLYIAWGRDYDSALVRSISSVKHWHPELPHKVAWLPQTSNLLCKSRMYELSPFDETCFLDADTTVLGNLDYGFEQAAQYGIALCISANPWQRRYANLPGHPDAVEYSSGVLFFSKNRPGVRRVFQQWTWNNALDSSTQYASDDGAKEQKYNDQALLTLALHDVKFCPFVLPQNWNLHPTWQKSFFGEIKVWHGTADIPASLVQWNEEQRKPDAIIRAANLPT